MVGGCRSTTVMLNVHEAEFRYTSEALNVTIVEPSGKLEPGWQRSGLYENIETAGSMITGSSQNTVAKLEFGFVGTV